MICEPGQLIGHRLATDLQVEIDVLQRERRLGAERAEHLSVVLGERSPDARDRDQTVDPAAWLERPERHRDGMLVVGRVPRSDRRSSSAARSAS